MNNVQKQVLKNISDASKGDLERAVPRLQYEKNLGEIGLSELADIIESLDKAGYIRKAGTNKLGNVYLTELGRAYS
ncbi:hypothetical protein [Adonisia turfae]|nr:hypothetical protein [Adonisia turfae]